MLFLVSHNKTEFTMTFWHLSENTLMCVGGDQAVFYITWYVNWKCHNNDIQKFSILVTAVYTVFFGGVPKKRK